MTPTAIETKSAEIKSAETKSAFTALENKAGRTEPGPVQSAMETFAAAFDAFKETNDARLGQIEDRLSSDVVTEEKLARIDAALDAARTRLDRISLDRARPPLGEPRGRDEDAGHEHKAAFDPALWSRCTKGCACQLGKFRPRDKAKF